MRRFPVAVARVAAATTAPASVIDGCGTGDDSGEGATPGAMGVGMTTGVGIDVEATAAGASPPGDDRLRVPINAASATDAASAAPPPQRNNGRREPDAAAATCS